MKYIGKIGSVRILLSIVCVNRQNKCTVGKHIIDILFCYYYYYIHFRYIVIVNRKSFTLRLNICIHVIVASIPKEVIRDRGTILDIHPRGVIHVITERIIHVRISGGRGGVVHHLRTDQDIHHHGVIQGPQDITTRTIDTPLIQNIVH